jgi:17beta-estradiol 17-dehydrogenase / very-long-chain 3-oxoacyl-CoA reductase
VAIKIESIAFATTGRYSHSIISIIIRTVLQAPFFVATRLVPSAVLDNWLSPLVPTPDTYARAAARWIGHGPLCTPTAGHQLLWCLAGVLPDAAHDWLRMREHLRLRALSQRVRAARASAADRGEKTTRAKKMSF